MFPGGPASKGTAGPLSFMGAEQDSLVAFELVCVQDLTDSPSCLRSKQPAPQVVFGISSRPASCADTFSPYSSLSISAGKGASSRPTSSLMPLACLSSITAINVWLRLMLRGKPAYAYVLMRTFLISFGVNPESKPPPNALFKFSRSPQPLNAAMMMPHCFSFKDRSVFISCASEKVATLRNSDNTDPNAREVAAFMVRSDLHLRHRTISDVG